MHQALAPVGPEGPKPEQEAFPRAVADAAESRLFIAKLALISTNALSDFPRIFGEIVHPGQSLVSFTVELSSPALFQ